MERDLFSLETHHSKTFWASLMIAAISVLCVIGLLEVYSTTSVTNISIDKPSYWSALMQGIFMIASVAICIAVAKIYPIFKLNATVIWVFWGICVLLVLAVQPFGIERNGAKRWLELGSFTIQPSEFLKIALMLVFVKILSEYKNGESDTRQTCIKTCIFIILPLAFLFGFQRDLGTTLICVVALLAVAYVSGISLLVLLGVVVVGVLGLSLLVFASDSFRSSRFLFLNPWNDGQNGQGDGFNIIRSYYAIAGGGIIGKGLGNSHEKYDYLFASDNDFIFAVICEELGLLGALLVIACVVAIFVSGLKLSSFCDSTETKLIVLGASTLITFQAFLNIGCAVGALPTTGKPFPFVSSGGSSILASFLLVGLIFNCINFPVAERAADRRRSKLEVIETRNPRTVTNSDNSNSWTVTNFEKNSSARQNSRVQRSSFKKFSASSDSKSRTVMNFDKLKSRTVTNFNNPRRKPRTGTASGAKKRRGYIDYGD